MLEYHMSYDYELMYNIEILVRNVVKNVYVGTIDCISDTVLVLMVG